MRVITSLGCVSCRSPLAGLGAATSGAAIVGVLVFAAIALTIAGRGKKARR